MNIPKTRFPFFHLYFVLSNFFFFFHTRKTSFIFSPLSLFAGGKIAAATALISHLILALYSLQPSQFHKIEPQIEDPDSQRLNHNSNFAPPAMFLSLLSSCSSLKQLVQIHAQIIISGLYCTSYITNKIIQLCTSNSIRAKNQTVCIIHAHRVVNYYQKLESSSWNSVIKAFATSDSDSGSQREAMTAFLDMRRLGVGPNEHTFPYVFKSCASFSGLNEGRQIHGDALKHGLHLNVYVQNTMINFYGCCKKLKDAYMVFDEMSHRTVVSWNSMISVNAECGWFYDSVGLFFKMRNSGFLPDETTMVIVVSACAEIGNLSLGKWLHSQVIANGMVVNCQLGTALVDMYGKCGDVCYASLVFNRMACRNVWTWSSMIIGLAQHGLARQALEIFNEMRNYSIKPNHVTFLGVLSACSHGGLLEDGQRYFKEMQQLYGIKPKMVHYSAIVDMLARGGRLREAYDFIMSMPVEADGVLWRALLSSCNIHDKNGCSGVTEKVKEKLIELEPKRCGNFVMIANNYAEMGLWEKAEDLRSKMREKGLKKIAGESCIEIAGNTFRFICGDASCVACEDLFFALNILNLHMKMIWSE